MSTKRQPVPRLTPEQRAHILGELLPAAPAPIFFVSARYRSYGYHARCEGLQASCTQSAELAARRAAVKAFRRSLGRRISENEITLEEVGKPTGLLVQVFWLFTVHVAGGSP